MKNLMVLVLIIAFQFSFANGSLISFNNAQFSDSTILKAKELKRLYLLSTTSSPDLNEYYQKQFFDAFPNTFKQLDELYGDNLDIHNQTAPLIDQADRHILKLFNNLKDVNDTLYYRKIISISIGGHWDADAINFFKHGLINKVLANPSLVVHILRGLSIENILSFWHFYFDGPVVEQDIDPSLQQIKDFDSKIYNLMIKAHDDEVLQNK